MFAKFEFSETRTSHSRSKHGLAKSTRPRYLPDDEGEDPYLMLGDDGPDEDETIDLPQLADKPAEPTYVPCQAASSSGAIPEPGTSDDSQSSSRREAQATA